MCRWSLWPGSTYGHGVNRVLTALWRRAQRSMDALRTYCSRAYLTNFLCKYTTVSYRTIVLRASPLCPATSKRLFVPFMTFIETHSPPASSDLLTPDQHASQPNPESIEPQSSSPTHNSTSSSEQMGLQHREYLSGSRIFGCSKCRTHLATTDDMISRVCTPSLPTVTFFLSSINWTSRKCH